jgi:hypothetical protein
MRKPEEFDFALNVSFLIMFIIYSCIALSGYYVFGKNVDVLVSINISQFPGKNMLNVSLIDVYVKNYYIMKLKALGFLSA